MTRDPLDPHEHAEERARRGGAAPAAAWPSSPARPRVSDQLGLVLDAAQHRGSVPDHVLLSGPPGLGKTTLAMIIAAELGAPLRITSGPAIQHAGDLAAILSGLTQGEVFFLDEIHRMSPSRRGDALPGDGGLPGRRRGRQGPGRDRDPAGDPAVHPGRRHHPRRACCPGRCATGSASPASSTSTTRRRCAHRPPFGAAARGRVGDERRRGDRRPRSRGTPRIANRLLRRVRDYAQVRADGSARRAVPKAALELYEVDELGLDRLDRAVLEALCVRFGGGPVGLSTLAMAWGRSARRSRRSPSRSWSGQGFLMRTPRGRVATARAWRHLGLAVPAGAERTCSPVTCSTG